ncbi:YdeI/OmpD-associated family protein [candidate division WOR-3 bacterium]|nr:YdeI/OmpD-associated family protein [candidate division WOR-3 bacterium]
MTTFPASMSSLEPLDFRSAAEWRKWLERNHAKSNGEWVYMYKKGTKTGLRYQEALDEALCFGWIDGQIHAVDEQKFRQRWTPRRKGSVWSQVNKNKVKRLIAEGRMCSAGLASIKEARKSGKWQAAYSNRREDAVPPDLAKVLRADPEAWRNFRDFARTYRNMYAGWVMEAKQEATRKRRMEAVVRRARENRKPGMDSLYT